jgi:guanosine-3',5'-bis(diphosphate) 3'-pyrophosphohydrolase
LVLRAAEFAADKHREEKRKGQTGRPYIGHCIEVAELIANDGKVDDATVLAAALLHDTVEDTKTTRTELVEKFGAEIDAFVAEVTDDKSLEKDDRKEMQVQHAPHLSYGAKLIKLADKISNVREIGADPPKGWDKKRRREYFEWATRVVMAMGSVNQPLEEMFARTVEQSSLTLDSPE